MVEKLPVQQVKYFTGARLLVLTQWGSCKPIQFAFRTVWSRPGDCQFGTSFNFGGDKLESNAQYSFTMLYINIALL